MTTGVKSGGHFFNAGSSLKPVEFLSGKTHDTGDKIICTRFEKNADVFKIFFRLRCLIEYEMKLREYIMEKFFFDRTA